MLNSTFPLDFIITVNSKREILLFHKYKQQTVSRVSEDRAAKKQLYLDKFNWSVKALDSSKLPELRSRFWHSG